MTTSSHAGPEATGRPDAPARSDARMPDGATVDNGTPGNAEGLVPGIAADDDVAAEAEGPARAGGVPAGAYGLEGPVPAVADGAPARAGEPARAGAPIRADARR